MSAITQEQLDKAVAETRGVLEQMLYAEVADLAKAAIGEPDGDEGGSEDAPPSAEGSAETPGASDASPGEAPGEASGADPGMDGGAPGGADGGSPPSMEQLVQEYSQLAPDELKMHMMAAQAAYEQVAGGAGGDAGAAGGPPGGMPPGGAPPAPGGAPGGPGGGAPPPGPCGPDEMAPAMKSELTKMFGELKKSMDDKLAAALRPRVGQRAVTGQNAAERLPNGNRPAAPAKRLSKAELTKRLSELTGDPAKLSKAERERITQFYDGGQRNLDLLKNIDGLKGLFQ